MADQTLDISWQAIIKVAIVAFIFYVSFLARNVILWFFFAIIVAILLEPAIKFLRWFKIPKVVAVVLVYLAIFGLIGLIIYLISPIFVFEIQQFGQNVPIYFERVNPFLQNIGFNVAENFDELTASLVSGLKESSASIIKAFYVFFGGVSSTLFIFTFAFFISLEESGPERVIALLVPKKYEHTTMVLFERAQFKVAGWFGARLLACLFVGALSFIIFFLLNVKYAFTLSLIAGLLNFVPFVGPLVSGLVTLLFVGVSESWLLAVYTLVALTAIQEIENKFLTPFLMKKFINLPPVLVLMSLLVGEALFGFLGMLFIVPVFGIIYEFTKEFLEKRKEEPAY